MSTIQLQGYILINFFASDQPSKLQLSAPHFRFSAFINYLVTFFFTLLSVTLLLYIQPLNGIIGIISKNSTASLSINIFEVIDREHQRIQVEQKSFSCKTLTETVTVTKTVTETVTVSNYVRHRSSGCCHIFKSLNVTPITFKHYPI